MMTKKLKQTKYANLTLVSITLLVNLFAARSTFAGAKDDPLLTKVMVDQVEWRAADEKDPLVVEGQVWIGKDLNKLWFKAEA